MTVTRDIDQQDVDISQLFRWTTSVDIRDPHMDLETTVYLRLVGDADLNRARAYALRKSAEMRKALKTEGTDERIAFVNELNDFEDKETLVTMIILLMLMDIQEEALNEVTDDPTLAPEPKRPGSDATLEEQEAYRKAIDEYPEVFREALEGEIQKIREREENRLMEKDMDSLYDIYMDYLIDRLCSEEMNEAYYDMCVYLGSYKTEDFERNAFPSFEHYRNTAGLIKQTLRENYQNLEIGMSSLKKSQEAMQ